VFPVTVIVWEGPSWFGGCQIEALVHVFGEIDVCLCESEIGLWWKLDAFVDTITLGRRDARSIVCLCCIPVI
jgi:hypothetical protein